MNTAPVHLVGISFGGMIAQATALARPDLIHTLTLIGTASWFPDKVRDGMRTRAELIRREGMGAVVQSSLERWFTEEFRERRPDIMDRTTKTPLGDDPTTQAAIWDLIATLDTDNQLSKLACPTLILVGEHDPSTPPMVATASCGVHSGRAPHRIAWGVTRRHSRDAGRSQPSIPAPSLGGSRTRSTRP